MSASPDISPARYYIGDIDPMGVVAGEWAPTGGCEHSDLDYFNDERWRFLPLNSTVYWTDDEVACADSQFIIENWLERRGFKVKDHKPLDYFQGDLDTTLAIMNQGLNRSRSFVQ